MSITTTYHTKKISDGDVITAWRGRVDNLHNPFQAEMISCLQGVQATIDLGISYLEVETDAKMVRHAIMSNDFDMSEEGVLVQELKEFMCLNFTRVSMVHNPRECNQVAHALAILGKE
jgi:hypothetical protein